jgi:hypothetical protein
VQIDWANKWIKILTLEMTIFDLNLMVKSGLELFYYDFLHAPSKITANLPGQFSHSGQILFQVSSSNSEVAHMI